jgi:eukaryotic-like serine/threonine-protein kinase
LYWIHPIMGAAIHLQREHTVWDPALDEHSDMEAWLGASVGGRHRIVKHLASGGMGHVFLAEHVTLGAQAAVKVLATRSTPALASRFIGEARLLSTLNHPNIVKVFDVGELDDESPYMLMEYVPGIDLSEWLEQNESISVKRILRILRQVACAIDHLHGQGIVHRDIKPANIMIDPDANDAVKLLDFGIAIREGSRDSEFEQGFLGTPAYMAPEQVLGNSCGRAVDLYALGALALELLTGKPPYDYPSLNLVLAAVMHEPPSLPSSRGIHISGFDAIMERALAREPRERFQSARELVDALTVVLSGLRSSQSEMAGTAALAASWAKRMNGVLGPVTRGAVALACGAMVWLA